MVPLERRAQGAEHGEGVRAARLGHLHRLEAPLERGVLFDVPAVFLRRGRADDLHLAAPQRGLEDVGRVDRPLGAARTDDGVQLVDEEDDVPGAAHVLEYGFDALLKVAAVLGAGEHGRHVERDDALAQQLLRPLAAGEAQREPLGDRRLAHARLPDEDGVVLRAPREDLHRPADLVPAAHYGVDLPGEREGAEIAAVLVEHARLRAAGERAQRTELRPPLGGGTAEHVKDRGVELVQIRAVFAQDRRAAAVRLPEDPEQEMLRADAALAEGGGLLCSLIHRLPGTTRERLPAGLRRAYAVEPGEGEAELLLFQAAAAQQMRPEPLALAQDPQHEVLRADEAVPQLGGRLVGLLDRQLRAPREFLIAFHVCTPFGQAHYAPAPPPIGAKQGSSGKSIASFSRIYRSAAGKDRRKFTNC